MYPPILYEAERTELLGLLFSLQFQNPWNKNAIFVEDQ